MNIKITIGGTLSILAIIGTYFIFKKAGEEGWKAIIPFYNEYTEYKFTWNTEMFWVQFALELIFFACCVTVAILPQFGGETVSTAAWILGIVGIGIITGIARLVILILENYKLSKHFGHGIGFTVGLVLLKPVFRMILGLDESVYSFV